MNAREAIRTSFTLPDFAWKAYIGDLTEDELLVRPVPGANHIKWQLGHLIASEHSLIDAVCPGSMPPLPAGFAEKHTSETASVDDPAAFHSKDEYLRVFDEQRAGTLAALDKLSDSDLDQPTPERYQRLGATVGAIFAMQPTHWMMHAGQWTITRRKLGKPPLF
ncbi:MAG: DinB family protein [Planctomycetes bacterium]|nr:DinB family protein [Planctomycetota bacterium]